MGYSLCMMADFQMFSFLKYLVFFEAFFLHRATVHDL